MTGLDVFFRYSKKPLPYDAEVEYLQSTGTQWIDTGVLIIDIYSNPTSKIRFMPLKKVSDLFQGIFGCANAANTTVGGWFCYINQNNFLSIAYGDEAKNPTSSASLSKGIFYEVEMRKNNLFIDGEYSGSCIQGTSFGGQRLALFTRKSNTTSSRAFVGRIFSCSIFNDGIIVRDYIPVRFTNENGVSEGAMYDKVTKQLFRNQGTGSFIVGPDK